MGRTYQVIDEKPAPAVALTAWHLARHCEGEVSVGVHL
jgi:hypothetical protein